MTKSTTRVAADLQTFTQTEITAKDIVAKAGRKNLIINGGFDVWQRGVSHTSLGYGADRWAISSASAVAVVKENDSAYGNVAAVTINGVDTNYAQAIENLSGLFLSKEVTLSFWVKSDTITSSKIQAYNGAAFTLDISYDITSSWTKVSKTFNTGSSYTAGTVFRVYILRASNTTGTVRFANVQLELGSVATDFEHRSYGEELALCQRYYQIYGKSAYVGIATGIQTASTEARFCFIYSAPMRVPPTLSHDSLIVTDRVTYDLLVSDFTDVVASVESVYIRTLHQAGANTNDAALLVVRNSTTGYLALDAEL
jgi:hypothetical protein